MSETINRARRSLEVELRRAEAHVTKVRKALAAMQALNGRGEGKRVSTARMHNLVCQCGTHFQARRSDARFCHGCRDNRRRPKKKAKPVTLGRNTPTAAKK